MLKNKFSSNHIVFFVSEFVYIDISLTERLMSVFLSFHKIVFFHIFLFFFHIQRNGKKTKVHFFKFRQFVSIYGTFQNHEEQKDCITLKDFHKQNYLRHLIWSLVLLLLFQWLSKILGFFPIIFILGFLICFSASIINLPESISLSTSSSSKTFSINRQPKN